MTIPDGAIAAGAPASKQLDMRLRATALDMALRSPGVSGPQDVICAANAFIAFLCAEPQPTFKESTDGPR